ncbi:MAG TPA: protein kinase [Streptosporangiaceae bacterium]
MPGGGREGPDDRPGPADRAGAGGWQVPGYSPVRELGSGRYGRVVLAVDDVTQTPVAVKYLTQAADAGRRRVADAANALSRLEDPNLVQFYEYAAAPDGGAAIVSEYVDGVSLRRLLAAVETAVDSGGIGPEAALSVLSGSLLALVALHGAGLAHGSYGPENVLILRDGMPKLSDACVGEAPRYAPPERERSAAGDLYAATAVFVECLAGARAVPEPFRALVAAGLSADPAGRPASAAAFLTELDEAATAAYGPSWERTGRARLAEQAAWAATIPAPAPARATPATRPVPHVPRPREPEPEPEPEPRPDTGSANPQPPVHSDPPRYPPTPFDTGPLDTGPLDTGPFDTSLISGSRRRARIALGVGLVAVIAGGAAWYAVSGRSSPDATANTQASTASQAPPSARPRPPTRAAVLARAISQAVATRRTATFTYRAPGVAAQGTLAFSAGVASAYDMNVTPLAGNRRDPRHPACRVVLLRDKIYVARDEHRKVYPAAGGAPRDPDRGYVTLAAGARQGGSVHNILVLLRSTAAFHRSGYTYRGVVAPAKLAGDRAVGALYARAPRHAVIAYTLDMAQNLLPRQLTVTIRAPGGRQWVYRTTYTGWGHGPSIAPPR